jgi:hypothetical protein
VPKEHRIPSRCSFTSLEEISGLHAVVDEALSTAENKLRNEKRDTRSDFCALEKRLSERVQTERKAAAYDDFLKRKFEYGALSARYKARAGAIEALRASRKKMLSDMPLIQGLEIGGDSPLYHNGVVRGIMEAISELPIFPALQVNSHNRYGRSISCQTARNASSYGHGTKPCAMPPNIRSHTINPVASGLPVKRRQKSVLKSC